MSHHGGVTAVRRVTVPAVLLVTCGCSGLGTGGTEDARETAMSFYAELAQDPARACELLAPGTLDELESSQGPCEQSLREEVPSATQARHDEVFGKQAIVELDQDTAFLAKFDDGWRITAAGCSPRDERPYDCSVKGP